MISPNQSHRNVSQIFDVTWPHRALWHQQFEQVVQTFLKFKDVWRVNNIVWEASKRNEPWVEAVKQQLVTIREEIRLKKEAAEERRKKEEDDKLKAQNEGLLRMADILQGFADAQRPK